MSISLPALNELESFYLEITKDNIEQERILKGQLTEVSKKKEAIEEKYFVLSEMTKEIYEKFRARYTKESLEIQEQLETVQQIF